MINNKQYESHIAIFSNLLSTCCIDTHQIWPTSSGGLAMSPKHSIGGVVPHVSNYETTSGIPAVERQCRKRQASMKAALFSDYEVGYSLIVQKKKKRRTMPSECQRGEKKKKKKEKKDNLTNDANFKTANGVQSAFQMQTVAFTCLFLKI